jgi:hypothetical protein
MSGLMFWDDRVLRPDEGGASVSSFLLFADVLASFALCVITGGLFSSAPAIFPGSRLAGVRRVDRWAGNSDGGGISGCGVRRFEEIGGNGGEAAGNTSPKSTSLT